MALPDFLRKTTFYKHYYKFYLNYNNVLSIISNYSPEWFKYAGEILLQAWQIRHLYQ